MWLDRTARALERVVDPISRWMNIIAVSILMVMIFFVTADVFLRYCLDRPIEGSYEAVELMMVFVFAFGIAYTQRHKGHVSVNMLVSRFSGRTQAVVDSVIYFISLGFLIILTWQTILRSRVVWLAGDMSQGNVAGITHVSFAPFNYMIALACAVLSMVLLADFLISLSTAVRK